MDKKTFLAIGLIGAVMVIWMIYSNSMYKQIPSEQEYKNDTTKTRIIDTTKQNITTNNNDTLLLDEKFGKYFEPFATGNEQFITINTDNYSAVISTKGGSFTRWQLKHYNKWDGVPAQLINYKESELYLRFTTMEAKRIDSRDLYFDVEGTDNINNITLKGNETKTIYFKLSLENEKELVKKITFYGNKYHIEQDITIKNLDDILKGGYLLVWGHNLNYQEKNSIDETNYSEVLISQNGSIDNFDATDEELESKDFTGIIDYAAIKTKYFTTAIIPQPWQKFDGTVYCSGLTKLANKDGKVEDYQVAVNVQYKGGTQTNGFKVFIGPIEYKLVQSYGLEATVDLGWRFLIRPIAEYLMLPLFKAVHSFIPNYGIAIIVFALLMKILLTPLSIQQLRNASYMRLLQPEIQKIRDETPDNKQKQQMATMQVYTEYGINPASGCLPLLIQMPILFALWRTLNGFIELRHQPFVLWINDLSSPDVLFSWGFSILGMTHISGLAVLMAVAMFLQQKMTITDPNQKAMVYVMPLMFLFMFSNFPSGLNLYYFVFNLLAIVQQVYINKISIKNISLADLKAKAKKGKKKEGWLAKQMRMAQEMQKTTGKQLPPSMQRYIDAKESRNNANKNNTNKNKSNRKK